MIERLRNRILAGAAGEVSSPESTLCADSYLVSIPALCYRTVQWHIKDPGHSAKSADGRLHLNMHTPLTHRSRSGLNMPHLSGNELSRNSSGKIWSQSSQLAEPLWTDPGLKSGISLCKLISTYKKKKKKRW